MEETVVTININKNSKAEYRKELITLFLDEEPGSLSTTTRYLYFVENLSNGNRIYLKRPTQLNKGVDFEVRVENTHFRYGKYGNIITTGNRPSHPEIKSDFEKKLNEDKEKYNSFLKLVDKVYKCDEISVHEMTSLKFNNSFEVEMILKVLKWLFIEQDVTYWNKSGREMLYFSLTE